MKKFYSKPELEIASVEVNDVTCSIVVDKEIYKQGDATVVGTVNYGEIFGA